MAWHDWGNKPINSTGVAVVAAPSTSSLIAELDSTMLGTVLALGDGPVSSKGVTLDHFVEVGNRVLFSPDAGQEVIFEKDVLVFLDENDILAVID